MLEDAGDVYDTNLADLSVTVTYLEGSFTKIENSPYQLAIVTYALQLAGSSQAAKFLQKLETYKSEDGTILFCLLNHYYNNTLYLIMELFLATSYY